MVARNVNAIYSAGGRLAYGVTNFAANSGVFPYNGTELGVVSSAYILPPNGLFYLPAEDFGGATTRAIYIGGDAVAGVRLAQYHNDILSVIAPGYSAGSGAGSFIKYPANVGQTSSTLTNLYYEAENSEHPSWAIPIATVELEESERLWTSHYRRLQFPVVFRSQPDANGTALILGLKAAVQGEL